MVSYQVTKIDKKCKHLSNFPTVTLWALCLLDITEEKSINILCVLLKTTGANLMGSKFLKMGLVLGVVIVGVVDDDII
jgi:hypothetical protein